MADFVLPTAADREALQELLDAVRRLRTPGLRPDVQDDEPSAPELYLAMSLEVIPAAAQASGRCEVSRVLDAAPLTDAGFIKDVWNLGPAIPPTRCLIVARDKWGKWWVLQDYDCPQPATTTTTPGPVCSGTCVFEWDDTDKTWTQTDSDCNVTCECVPPSYCGSDVGETTQTSCNLDGLPDTPPCPGTTTTTTTTSEPCPTTTTPAVCSAGCDWIYLALFGARWLRTEDNCTAFSCQCDPPTDPGVDCQTAHTDCIAPTTTTTTTSAPVHCYGTNTFWCDESDQWQFLDGQCITNLDCECYADWPTVPCSCGALVAVDCVEHCSTTTVDPCAPSTTTTSTTTTTPAPCSGTCLWMWNVTLQVWINVSNLGCGGCQCYPPSYPGQADGETNSGACTATTTTPNPCCDLCTPPDDLLITLTVGSSGCDCTGAGGQFVMTPTGFCSGYGVSGCGGSQWQSPQFSYCGGALTGTWTLGYVKCVVSGLNHWTLSLSAAELGGVQVLYEHYAADCAVPVSLQLVSWTALCPSNSTDAVLSCGTATTTTTTTPAPSSCAYCADGTYPGGSITLDATVDDAGCENCSDASGTFTLDVTGDPCVWESAPIPSSDPLCENSDSWTWRLSGANGLLVLQLLDDSLTSILTWIVPLSANDCTLPKTLTFNSGNISHCTSGASAVIS